MKTTETIVASLTAAIEAREKAKIATSEENPLHGRDLKEVVNGASIVKSQDKYPAQNMTSQSTAGYAMEAARREAEEVAKIDKSTQRKAAQRARAARKVQFDAIAAAPVKPSKERLELAWRVVWPMDPIVRKIAVSKQRWAGRFLGNIADDVASNAIEAMVLVLAKSDRDLAPLIVAADELGEKVRRTDQIPGDQLTDDERKDRKQRAKNRKWLMGMANNRVMGALVDAYTSVHNLRWDNLDMIGTIMANISGVGEDPMTARFKADRAPAFLGTRFCKPGGFDPNLLAVAISAGITERGLDAMTEIILNEDNRRVDGSMKWSACAESLFLATPELGEWIWDTVVAATEGHKNPRKSRAKAARTHVRNQFAWLPLLIVETVEAFDWRPIGFGQQPLVRSEYRVNAVMASDFELIYMGEAPTPRKMLEPSLALPVGEAAQVLVETLGELLTGTDLINSLVNA